MTKRTNKKAAQAPPPRNTSSDSENSDMEDRSHSRTSTSSVEQEQVKEQNGHGPRPTADEKGSSSVTFFSRVSSIPLIHDLNSYARENKYSGYVLNTAESAVGTVSKYTESYQARLQPHLQPHIAKVDKLASKSLDLFETTFPIVKKPTSEIVTQVKKPYVYVEESSKSAYTQIQTTIDTRVTAPVKSVTSSIASTAASTRDQITNAATSTKNNITSAATSTATTIATTVNTHATPLVNGLETIVDRILPAEGENEKAPAGQSNQATRVVDITRSVQARVTRRVSVAVAPVTESAAVVKSKDQLHALNDRLNALIKSLREQSQELQENVKKAPHEASTRVQTRVSELSSKVLKEVDSVSKYLKEHSPSLPQSVQNRLQPLMTFVNDRYVVVKTEIVKSDVSPVQKARNILHLTTEETLPILQNAAQDVRDSLVRYQVKAQESVHKGLTKVQEVHSSVNLAAARAVHSVRVILVGK
ncbi:hypothetical protein EC968_006469 [Mortierella alpina]|nr:hypothetical protein EC968_006469 [Mortierella alpina]